MALVRCDPCGKPRGRTRTYVGAVEPLGYPDTAAICGRTHCKQPRILWLDVEESLVYRLGERIFGVPHAAMKVKAK